MPSAHTQLLLLDSLARRPDLRSRERAILERFAHGLWTAHREARLAVWTWPFTERHPNKARVFIDAHGVDARSVLMAFSKLDDQIRPNVSLEHDTRPGSGGTITTKAVMAITGLATSGRWIFDPQTGQPGFSFWVPS